MARAIVVLALLVLALAIVSSSPELRRRARPALERLGVLRPHQESARYHELVERHRRENLELRSRCVLLLGDSLTEAFPTRLTEPRGWALRGISGDRVRHVRNRLEGSVLGAPCSEIAILAGSNDVIVDGATPRAVGLEVASLAETLRANGRQVVITTLPPARGRFADANGRISAVNEELRALSAQGFTVVDLHRALADTTGQLDERFSRDGLHLTVAAYERWAELLDEVLPGSAR